MSTNKCVVEFIAEYKAPVILFKIFGISQTCFSKVKYGCSLTAFLVNDRLEQVLVRKATVN